MCHLSIFAQARGWVSLCEFMLSQCLVDVDATHEVCVFVSLSVLTAFMLEDHQRFSNTLSQFVIHTRIQCGQKCTLCDLIRPPFLLASQVA